MTSFEINKIVGSILMAGLIAMAAGQVAKILYQPKHLEKTVLAIEVAGSASPAEAAKAAAPALPLPQLLAKADPAAGQQAAKKCIACHTFDKGGANKIGPNLYGVVARKPAGSAGFSYSPAMAGQGEPWSYARLYDYLTDPKALVPGTKMAFAGIRKAEERADILAYMRTLSDAPVAFPAP